MKTAPTLVLEVAPFAAKTTVSLCRPRHQATRHSSTNCSGDQPYLPRGPAAAHHRGPIQPFTRFLQVAARHHAQLLNVERVAQQTAGWITEVMPEEWRGFSSSHWRPEWSEPLHTLLGHDAVAAAYGIYLGKKPILMEGLTVLPFRDFSDRLWAGDIF